MYEMSVVIVSWNAKDFLEKCIVSILHENVDNNIEIIVVDNGSSDGSQDMIRSQFKKVKLICNTENLGFARANNIGLRLALGNYFFLINSDVVVLPNSLDPMIRYIKEHQGIGMLGPKILNPDMSLQRSCRGFPTLWNLFCRALALDTLFPKVKLFGGRSMTFWEHDSIKDVEVLSGCFWLLNRKAVEEVGLLDEDFFIYAEDVDWCKRFMLAGWRRVYYPLVQAIHYGGGSSDNSPIRFFLEMQRANLHYWKKHHGPLGQITWQIILLLHHSLRMIGEFLHYLVTPGHRKEILHKIQRSFACIKWIFSKTVRH